MANCKSCIHASVCEELEKFRDPLGWTTTTGEFACSYYDTADVVEVKHGEWKYIGADKRGRGGIFNCSLCNGYRIVKSDYCPDCGAKMDGKPQKEGNEV